MSSRIQEELTPILRSLAVLSPATFTFRGEPVQVTPGPVQPLEGTPSHPLPQTPLIREIQALLYARCYSHRFEDNQPPPGATTPFTPDPSFVERLSRGNHTQARWEPGWMIYAVSPNGQVSLQKGDRQRTAVPGEFITSGPPGMPPQPGAVVSVFVAREATNAQPGFYFLYGATLSDVWDDHALLRFYFNVKSDAAPDLLDRLTRGLNRYQVPFRMKVLIEPAMYPRTDSAVLYIAKRHYGITARIVLGLPQDVLSHLGPSTPLFSHALLPGVGLAEDPGTGESFGMHRCRLTAEGIVEAWMRGDQSLNSRLEAIQQRFTANGLNLDKPYLSSGSVDLHEIPMRVSFAYA